MLSVLSQAEALTDFQTRFTLEELMATMRIKGTSFHSQLPNTYSNQFLNLLQNSAACYIIRYDNSARPKNDKMINWDSSLILICSHAFAAYLHLIDAVF